jgi:phosphatidylglycerol:prolipoprotein diacylglycerol transferase
MSDIYPWFLSLGALAGLLWLGLVDPIPQPPKPTLSPITRVDAGLSALIIGLLGARIGYVITHMAYYSHSPGEILFFWKGGLTWVGGAIGAIVGLSLYSALSRNPFWRLADALAFPGTFLAFALWFGCMLDACAYGKLADFGFLTPTLEDTFGIKAKRWPVQSIGAIYSLGILALLNKLQIHKVSDGVIASLSLGMIAAGNFLLAFLRGDQVPILFGIRFDAIGSAALFILGALSLLYCIRKGEKA